MNPADYAIVRGYRKEDYPQVQREWDANGVNLIYDAIGLWGAADGDIAWIIFKLTYDGNNNPVRQQSTKSPVAWTSRAVATYG